MYICDIYQSLKAKNCLQHICSTEPISITSKSKRYIFTKEYLLSWFPNLPSYQTFNRRLKLMSEVINELVKHLIIFFKPIDCDSMISLIDSMPFITCAGNNKTGKAATEVYCSIKNMYYFGLKLHTFAFRRVETIPFFDMIILSSTKKTDLSTFKREATDKIYSESSF